MWAEHDKLSKGLSGDLLGETVLPPPLADTQGHDAVQRLFRYTRSKVFRSIRDPAYSELALCQLHDSSYQASFPLRGGGPFVLI